MTKATHHVSRRPAMRPGAWVRIVLLLAVAAVLAYRGWQAQQQPPAEVQEQPPKVALDDPPAESLPVESRHAEPSRAESSPPAAAEHAATIIRNQTIRGLDGEVAYDGDVDVGPTLARIRAGQKLPYRNDGSTFQNRERRLPRKPSGYYREYVHETPGLEGPGPQRIVVGRQGETYYTADHYRTFRRVDAP